MIFVGMCLIEPFSQMSLKNIWRTLSWFRKSTYEYISFWITNSPKSELPCVEKSKADLPRTKNYCYLFESRTNFVRQSQLTRMNDRAPKNNMCGLWLSAIEYGWDAVDWVKQTTHRTRWQLKTFLWRVIYVICIVCEPCNAFVLRTIKWENFPWTINTTDIIFSFAEIEANRSEQEQGSGNSLAWGERKWTYSFIHLWKT